MQTVLSQPISLRVGYGLSKIDVANILKEIPIGSAFEEGFLERFGAE